MLLFVSQQDIDYCVSQRKGWHNPCPIVFKLRRLFPCEYVLVSVNCLIAGEKYKKPQIITDFQVSWDSYEDVEPFEIELEEYIPFIWKSYKYGNFDVDKFEWTVWNNEEDKITIKSGNSDKQVYSDGKNGHQVKTNS